MLEIKSLDGFRIYLEGQRVTDIGSRKAEALLVYLAMAGHSLNRKVMAALLWPRHSEDHASKSLRVVLSALRRSLPGCLEISRDFVSFQANLDLRFDVSEMKDALNHKRVGKAIKLYQGEFLAGFQVLDCEDFEIWQAEQNQRIIELLGEKCHNAIQSPVSQGNYRLGLSLSKSLIDLNPMDEEAHYQLIHLYLLNGDRKLALDHYQAYKDLFQQELGLAPAEKISALIEPLHHMQSA